MKANVTMRYNATAEVRVIRGVDWWQHSPGYWGRYSGNAGCDCNRHLLFERVLNPEYDDDELNDGEGFGCGHSAYDILSIETEAGKPMFVGEPDPDVRDPSWPEYTDEVHAAIVAESNARRDASQS